MSANFDSNGFAGDKIDTNLYSRQIGAFGIETMGKLIQLKVLIIGLRGAGIEVCSHYFTKYKFESGCEKRYPCRT